MSITFTNAKPVARNNPGRTPAENPFTKVVAEIALKKDSDGVPIARAFTFSHPTNADETKRLIAKNKRQLSEAGRDNDPKVTLNTAASTVTAKGVDTTTITFWTTPFVPRPRKAKTDAATETANTTDAAATEAPDKA